MGEEIMSLIAEVAGDRDGTIDFAMFEQMLHQHEGFLKGLEVFRSLDTEEIRRLMENVEVIRHVRNDVVVRQGDVGTHFYIVEEGACAIYMSGVRKKTMRSGDHFGETVLVNNVAHIATVVVESDEAELIAIDKAAFRRILPRTPLLASASRLGTRSYNPRQAV